jgi:hypothetical protein
MVSDHCGERNPYAFVEEGAAIDERQHEKHQNAQPGNAADVLQPPLISSLERPCGQQGNHQKKERCVVC